MMPKRGFVPSHRVPFDQNWAKEMRDRTIRSVSEHTDIALVFPPENLTCKGLVADEQDAKKNN